MQTESNSGDKDEWGWDEPVTTTTTIIDDSQQRSKDFDHLGLHDKEEKDEISVSDGSFDDFDDFDNFDDQTWGHDDNQTTTDERINIENESSASSEKNSVTPKTHKTHNNPTSAVPTKQANNKVKGMSLKSKTAMKKSQKASEEKTDIDKNSSKVGDTASVYKPKRQPVKGDLGDEFSIKINEKNISSNTEPDYFADMMPSFNDTSKITKTTFIERKDGDSLSSKFQVTAPTASLADRNTVSC